MIAITPTQLFKVGDIVRWTTFAGTRCVAVVEVWDDEPKRLLVTDVEHTTMDTKPVLQCDCELVERREETQVKKYTRRIETARELPKYNDSSECDV